MYSGQSKQGGPLPKFNDYHLWKALDCLDGKNPIGRKRLAELLGIGEGSTRTIISMLQDHGLITIGKSGIFLTSKGLEFKRNTHMDVIRGVQAGNVTIGEKDVIVRVPKMARSIGYGCEERDAAIRSGATGATTLVYTGGRLSFPGSDFPVDSETENAIRDTLGEDAQAYIDKCKTGTAFSNRIGVYLRAHRELVDNDPDLTEEQKEDIWKRTDSTVKFVNLRYSEGRFPEGPYQDALGSAMRADTRNLTD